MSYPDEDFPGTRGSVKPIPVVVREMPTAPPRPRPTKTVAYTVIINGNSGSVDDQRKQIAAYEPTRMRLAIHASDSGVNIVIGETPRTSPDASSSTVPPAQGIFHPGNDSAPPWEFYGCDLVWLNAASNTPTRVGIIKEYE